jgi:adenylate cyclase
MEPKAFHRKLTAILSADFVGYNRLMGEDEAATVKTLELYKGIMSELNRQHRGRVVDSPGDNLLAEFASVVEAVQCAVATQKELQARNTELTENRKMQFRIGVNLGDVIEEEPQIYGDGVNIAARLEALADPGGICISKTAFDHIESKLPFGYAYLGEQTVKNIAKPVGAYRVVLEPRVTKKKASGLKQGAGRRIAHERRAAALRKSRICNRLSVFCNISSEQWRSAWWQALFQDAEKINARIWCGKKAFERSLREDHFCKFDMQHAVGRYGEPCRGL